MVRPLLGVVQLLSAGSIMLFGSLAYAMDSVSVGVTPLSLGTMEGLPPLRLVGAVGGGGGAYSRAPSGLFIGADTGWAVMLGEGAAPAHDAWTFGARAGYEWRNGLALEARFDDLGVAPPLGGGPLLTATGGVRYSMPFIVMPFAEALVGPAFNGTHVAPAAGIGLGASLPVLRHLMFDLSVRDWIADIDGAVRNVPTIELGVTVGFAGR